MSKHVNKRRIEMNWPELLFPHILDLNAELEIQANNFHSNKRMRVIIINTVARQARWEQLCCLNEYVIHNLQYHLSPQVSTDVK